VDLKEDWNKLEMVVHPCNLALRRLRQEDYMFEAETPPQKIIIINKLQIPFFKKEGERRKTRINS
jgi:hypothetical protein